jgi:hypothetical protein
MVRLTACRCTGSESKRVSRAAWMRALFPQRSLFECSACQRRFLVQTGDDADKGNWPVAVVVLGVLCAVPLGALWVWSSPPVAASSVSAAAQPPLQPTQASCHRVHIFKAGETFESIADAELGDPAKWQEIRIANREWLDVSATGLEPGARLVVPVPCAS